MPSAVIPPSRRRRWPVIVLAAVFVVFAAGAAAYHWSRSGAPAEADAAPSVPTFAVVLGGTGTDPLVAALAKAGTPVEKLADVDLAVPAGSTDTGPCTALAARLAAAADAARGRLKLPKDAKPVLVAADDAAQSAFAAAAAASSTTFAGLVTTGFPVDDEEKFPLCPLPAKMVDRTIDGAERDPSAAPKPEIHLDLKWRLVVSGRVPDPAEAFTQLIHAGQVISAPTPADIPAKVAAAVAAVGSADDARIERLPLTIMAPKGAARSLVVILSGDGGWRDLDKSIGETMAEQGIAVVGLDTMRYFWKARDPGQIATDLSAIIRVYEDSFDVREVALVGYSFGADVLPFAFPKMNDDERSDVRLISLLAPGRTTGFQVSIEGWLGLEDGDNDVVAAAAALPKGLVQCVYGSDETDDTACTAPALAGTEIVRLEGGHHFDEDYDALARRVTGAFEQRLASRAAATEPAVR